MHKSKKTPITVGLVGDGGVGAKSALLHQFFNRTFLEAYDPTIEDRRREVVTVDGEHHQCIFVDTTGQEEFQTIRWQSITQCEGFILGYDITNRNSLRSAVNVFLRELVEIKQKCKKKFWQSATINNAVFPTQTTVHTTLESELTDTIEDVDSSSETSSMADLLGDNDTVFSDGVSTVHGSNNNNLKMDQELNMLIKAIQNLGSIPFPIVLVGNKCDLEHVRQVSFLEGAELARTLKCPFFETSAKTGANVPEVVLETIRQVRHCRSKQKRSTLAYTLRNSVRKFLGTSKKTLQNIPTRGRANTVAVVEHTGTWNFNSSDTVPQKHRPDEPIELTPLLTNSPPIHQRKPLPNEW